MGVKPGWRRDWLSPGSHLQGSQVEQTQVNCIPGAELEGGADASCNEHWLCSLRGLGSGGGSRN